MAFLIANALIFTLGRIELPRNALLVSSVFAQNYSLDPHITSGVFVHLWSLAVEEHFYILLPVLLTVLAFTRQREIHFESIPGIFAFVALACFLLRWFMLPAGHLAWATHFRIDSLFAGVLLGYLYHFRKKWFQKMTGHYSLIVAFLLCGPAALVDSDSHFMQTFGLTSLMIGFSFLVAWCVDRTPKSRPGRMIVGKLALIGFYSYSIYLWHMYCYIAFKSMGNNAISFWASLAISVALGIVMSKVIEWPSLALREKWFPAALSRSCGSLLQASKASNIAEPSMPVLR